MKIEEVQSRIAELLKKDVPFSQKEICAKMLSFIDLTTLDGTDTRQKVADLCQKAKEYRTAAVCVYPFYAAQVKEALQGSGIQTACVAGGFPASQLPLRTKLFEVEQTLADGADEIDMVISQGAFLEGDYKRVGDEVKAIKDETISPRTMLFITGSEAHSREFSEDAYAKAAEPKATV